jgi:hypothetical protein
MLSEVLESETGRIILSILLGFGLATMFQKACSGNSCMVIRGPSIQEIKNKYYKIDDDCYTYTPVVTRCV